MGGQHPFANYWTVGSHEENIKCNGCGVISGGNEYAADLFCGTSDKMYIFYEFAKSETTFNVGMNVS